MYYNVFLDHVLQGVAQAVGRLRGGPMIPARPS
nr:MAG TPA: hypothetical protein [Inoviridae sp.]